MNGHDTVGGAGAQPGAEPAEPASPVAEFAGLVDGWSQRAAEWLHLLSIEGRAAALGLTTMLSLAVATAALAVSAWMFLALAVGLALADHGLSGEYVFLAIAIANAVLAVFVWRSIARLSRYLTFPATRRRVCGDQR